MIIFQILLGVLLIPLAIGMLLLFNVYVIGWFYLLFVAIAALIFSILFGFVFFSFSTAVWIFIIIGIVYMLRMNHLSRQARANKQSENNVSLLSIRSSPMNDEKKLILEMLSEGKINVTEAEKLLEAQSDTQSSAEITKSPNKKFVRIFVKEADKTKVNINIPIALAEVGLKLVPKDKLKIEGKEINLNEILDLIKEGSEGELINIDTMDNGKAVQVRVVVG